MACVEMGLATMFDCSMLDEALSGIDNHSFLLYLSLSPSLSLWPMLYS